MEEEDQYSSVICKVFSLYKKYGHEDYLGEPVTQIEHATQCAMLAEKQGYSNEVSHPIKLDLVVSSHSPPQTT